MWRILVLFGRHNHLDGATIQCPLGSNTATSLRSERHPQASKIPVFSRHARRENRIDLWCATRNATLQAPCTELHGRYKSLAELPRSADFQGKSMSFQRYKWDLNLIKTPSELQRIRKTPLAMRQNCRAPTWNPLQSWAESPSCCQASRSMVDATCSNMLSKPQASSPHSIPRRQTGKVNNPERYATRYA